MLIEEVRSSSHHLEQAHALVVLCRLVLRRAFYTQAINQLQFHVVLIFSVFECQREGGKRLTVQTEIGVFRPY